MYRITADVDGRHSHRYHASVLDFEDGLRPLCGAIKRQRPAAFDPVLDLEEYDRTIRWPVSRCRACRRALRREGVVRLRALPTVTNDEGPTLGTLATRTAEPREKAEGQARRRADYRGGR